MKAAGITGAGAFLHLKSFPMEPVQPAQTTVEKTVIGNYGEWARSFQAGRLPTMSFLRPDITNLSQWKESTRQRIRDLMSIRLPEGLPKVIINKKYNYDGLHIEELSWQLPYGRPTEAVLLKPQNAKGPLPAVLAFHDHGGNKYYGTKKIVRTSDKLPAGIEEHQKTYYEGRAWANELAKRGYAVLVPDTFTFASRRIMVDDVPEGLRHGYKDPDPNSAEEIDRYNDWANNYENFIGRSLFSAGTSYPGMWVAEDLKSLDILSSHPDVDKNKIGCCGLSGGGMRSVYIGGLDDRIKCSVPVGFMTTWNDFALYKSYTHTWMIYIPQLPNELDFPEILALRAPLPSLVLNNTEDQLFTLSEMKRADDILKQNYSKAGASDKYRCSFHEGLHKFDIKMQTEAFDWFDKHLK
jgi:dienelactone hydrolase